MIAYPFPLSAAQRIDRESDEMQEPNASKPIDEESAAKTQSCSHPCDRATFHAKTRSIGEIGDACSHIDARRIGQKCTGAFRRSLALRLRVNQPDPLAALHDA
ncbi:hypothetical protein V475_06990 [Sphingobium baderi LL03]|uniref:Uncharacterized protein n=1 Tax=Sphingobium baderi LL03 TaxID=1114964 RepID=T0H2P4_9SPHN|nr:hypothetical protein L485_01505 [Sphingobium baderi LL03]KMS62672.1 hypothetical protein V475_06990 [Sphingobium baderi LL03]